MSLKSVYRVLVVIFVGLGPTLREPDAPAGVTDGQRAGPPVNQGPPHPQNPAVIGRAFGGKVGREQRDEAVPRRLAEQVPQEAPAPRVNRVPGRLGASLPHILAGEERPRCRQVLNNQARGVLVLLLRVRERLPDAAFGERGPPRGIEVRRARRIGLRFERRLRLDMPLPAIAPRGVIGLARVAPAEQAPLHYSVSTTSPIPAGKSRIGISPVS